MLSKELVPINFAKFNRLTSFSTITNKMKLRSKNSNKTSGVITKARNFMTFSMDLINGRNFSMMTFINSLCTEMRKSERKRNKDEKKSRILIFTKL